jgi:hypothetical protein
MPQVGFESMISEFERANTDHASDLAATVIGTYNITIGKPGGEKRPLRRSGRRRDNRVKVDV